MKLSEMKQILAEGGIRLTKSLGQSFLHDGNQLRRILAAAELAKADQVLEIGPGLGPLTQLLVENAGQVLAIETDKRLIEFLRNRFGSEERLTLVHADALDYLRSQPKDWSGWKLVANLPYSIASPILVELAQSRHCPRRIVVTLQLEVARRIVARAGDSDYGLLALLLQLGYEPGGWFKIPASCFFPMPDVDSGCVTLVRRPQPLLAPDQAGVFTRVVKRGFSQRRKMMLKLLREDWPIEQVVRCFERLKLSSQVRAEEVSLEQFIELARMLDKEPRMNSRLTKPDSPQS